MLNKNVKIVLLIGLFLLLFLPYINLPLKHVYTQKMKNYEVKDGRKQNMTHIFLILLVLAVGVYYMKK